MNQKKSIQVLDRPQYRIWQGLYLAFFSPSFYIDVAKRWKGMCFQYVILLIFCATLPLSIRFGVCFNTFYTQQVLEPLHSMPTFKIEEGDIKFDHFMPYTISNDQGEITAMVDTTGVVKTINHQFYPKLTWLVTQHAISFSLPALHVMNGIDISFDETGFTQKITEDVTDTVSLNQLMNTPFIRMMIKFGIVMIYPSIALFFISVLGVMLMVFAWAAQFMVRVIFKENITYTASFRLLMVSLTAPLFLFFGLMASDVILTEGGFYYMILFAVYFCTSIIVLKRFNRVLVRA